MIPIDFKNDHIINLMNFERKNHAIGLSRIVILISLMESKKSITELSKITGVSYRNTIRNVGILKNDEYIKTEKSSYKNTTICSITTKGKDRIKRLRYEGIIK
jgi:DNA-binding MarR family transcriptional regulator